MRCKLSVTKSEFEKVLGMILKDKNLTNQFLQRPQAILEKLGLKTTAAVAQETNRRVKDLLKEGKTADQIIAKIQAENPHGNIM